MIEFSVGGVLFCICERNSKQNCENYTIYESASPEFIYLKTKHILSKFETPAQDLLFYLDDINQAWQQILSYFVVIHSAGGIVVCRNKFLFIKRKNRWDLPKGKVEKGESLRQAAQREILEETGVAAQCQSHLIDTWHCYNDFGPLTLKCTHWFELTCPDFQLTSPQTEEGIESVEWLEKEQVVEILPSTFHSVRQTFAAYESRKF